MPVDEVDQITIRIGTPADATNLADLAARTFRDTFADGTPADDMARYLAESYGPAQQARELTDPAIATLLAYALYTIDPQTVAKFGTDRLLWTVPFPLYGIFRYLYLVHQRDGGGNPSETLLTDRPILTCVALWGLAVILILYGPRS